MTSLLWTTRPKSSSSSYFCMKKYYIQPNDRTVRLGALNILVVKHVPNILRVNLKKKKKKKRSAKDVMLISAVLLFVWFSLSKHMLWVLIWIALAQEDAIQIGTHNKCLYKEADKKYTSCKLNTRKFLYCALLSVRVVIRSNTVHCGYLLKVLWGGVSEEYNSIYLYIEISLLHLACIGDQIDRSLWPYISITIFISILHGQVKPV